MQEKLFKHISSKHNIRRVILNPQHFSWLTLRFRSINLSATLSKACVSSFSVAERCRHFSNSFAADWIRDTSLSIFFWAARNFLFSSSYGTFAKKQTAMQYKCLLLSLRFEWQAATLQLIIISHSYRHTNPLSFNSEILTKTDNVIYKSINMASH